MWMEESAPRINSRRFAEAAATGAAVVATACPFCDVMLADAAQAVGAETPVRDVAQLLLSSVQAAN
jgi:Fe-S oxidoreductase